ncbi:MAG: PASTA domain-containing protein [Acidimicrobiales bacterium]
MPDHDELNDRRLEDRLRRALRWMAEDADGPTSPPAASFGTPVAGMAAGGDGPHKEDGLYIDEPTPPAGRSTRTLVLVAAALIVLIALAVPIGLVVTGGTDSHGSGSEGTAGTPDPAAKELVLSALSATTSADNWDVSYTYGEDAGSASPPTSTTIPCATSSAPVPVCSTTPGNSVTVTGTGIINVNPKAMVAEANVSNFGHVVLRIDSSQVWEILSGDSGGLAPGPGENASGGQSLPGYAGLVEGTLGTREGAVAMLGIASPTGYLELDEQATVGVTPAGTGTVDGQAVTEYKVSVAPSELASDPTASPEQVNAIQAALTTLDKAGMSGTQDQVAIDAQGFIVQSISTYHFRDGGSVTVQAEFSNFGCAGTVLMPGQTGPTGPTPGCVSPDTPAVSPTTTTTTAAAPPTTETSTTSLSPISVPTTIVPPGGGATTSTSQPTHSPSTVTVPNVLGLTPAQAAASLAQVGLTAQFVGAENYRVTSEAPVAGSNVPEYSTVVLTTQ